MATNPKERIAWDSVVVIDCLQKRKPPDDDRYKWIKPMVARAEADELEVCVCAMGVAETVRVPDKENDESVSIIQAFYANTWVLPVAVSIFIGEQAAQIQRDHRIDCADAVHVAAAIFAGCSIFLTNDGDHEVKKKRKSRPILGLDKKLAAADGSQFRIMTPRDYHEMKIADRNPIFTDAIAGLVQEGTRIMHLEQAASLQTGTGTAAAPMQLPAPPAAPLPSKEVSPSALIGDGKDSPL